MMNLYQLRHCLPHFNSMHIWSTVKDHPSCYMFMHAVLYVLAPCLSSAFNQSATAPWGGANNTHFVLLSPHVLDSRTRPQAHTWKRMVWYSLECMVEKLCLAYFECELFQQVPYSGLFLWVEIFVKSWKRLSELNFVILNFMVRDIILLLAYNVMWTLNLVHS